MSNYSADIAAVQTAISQFTDQLQARLQAAKTADNTLKLEGLTLNEIVQMIAGTTGLTIQEVQDSLDAHIAKTDNSHTVTKDQIGLGSVLNYSIANQTEAMSKLVSDKYLVPNVLWHVLDQFWTDKVNGAPAALDTLGEIAQALSNNPEVISDLTTLISTKAVQADIDNAVNNLTKFNVALDNVENYSIATKEEAEVGVATDKYMTPLRTKEATDFTFATIESNIDQLAASINDVTIGLELVENYRLATDAEAIEGISTELYLTPSSNKAAATVHRAKMEVEINAIFGPISNSIDNILSDTPNTPQGGGSSTPPSGGDPIIPDGVTVYGGNGEGYWVGYNWDGSLHESFDNGVTWTQTIESISITPLAVIAYQDKVLLISNDSYVYKQNGVWYTDDSIFFTMDYSETVSAAIYSQGNFYIVNETGIHYVSENNLGADDTGFTHVATAQCYSAALDSSGDIILVLDDAGTIGLHKYSVSTGLVTPLNLGEPTFGYNRIKFDSNDGFILYDLYGGQTEYHVYDPVGTSFTTYNFPVDTAAIELSSAGTWVIATNTGLIYTSNDATTWTPTDTIDDVNVLYSLDRQYPGFLTMGENPVYINVSAAN